MILRTKQEQILTKLSSLFVFFYQKIA